MAGNETANGTQANPTRIDALQIGLNLLGIQLVPLCVGLVVRHWRPTVAKWLQKPARRILGARAACDAALRLEELGRQGSLAGAEEASGLLHAELGRLQPALTAFARGQ
jgi:hypothetical protein